MLGKLVTYIGKKSHWIFFHTIYRNTVLDRNKHERNILNLLQENIESLCLQSKELLHIQKK